MRGRLLRALLGLSGFVVLAFVILRIVEFRQMRSFITNAFQQLGARVLDETNASFGEVLQDAMLHVADDRADALSAELRRAETETRQLAAALPLLWRVRAAGAAGVLARGEKGGSSYSVARGAAAGDGWRLPAAMDDLFQAAFAGDSNLTVIEIGTPGGAFRRYPAVKIPADFDVRRRPWYEVAAHSHKLEWTDAYLSITGHVQMSCSQAVYDADGKLAAVVSVAVWPQDIIAQILDTHLNNRGTAMLVDRDLESLARQGMAPAQMHWNDPLHRERFKLDDAADQQRLARDVKAGKLAILRTRYQDHDTFVAYAPVDGRNMAVLLLFKPELLQVVDRTQTAIAGQLDQFTAHQHDEVSRLIVHLLIVGFVLLLLVAWIARRLAHGLTKPLALLEARARVIGEGDWSQRITVNSGDEIESLGRTLNRMAEDLQRHVREMQRAAADHERIESELRVAREIQTSLMPRMFPPFPDRPEFELFATMVPAREVGGDLYDFFFIDERHLCLLIGDVADKSVPAALYMMVTKFVLRMEARNTLAPDQILKNANSVMAADNEKCMFVTVLCAILDTETGRLTMASAGHNPPVYRAVGEKSAALTVPRGFVVGVLPEARYASHTVTMRDGDMIVLYTDGVTEANDPHGDMFGESRLIECVSASGTSGATELVQQVQQQVEQFVAGAPQSDDMTLLALRYHGRSSTVRATEAREQVGGN